MIRQPFRDLFCQRFDCPSSEYEERAFRKCLYWHARFLAPAIRILKPDFFTEDLKFIGYLGHSTGLREALEDRSNFHDVNRWKGGLLRTAFRIRVSGRKASRLAERLF